MENSTAPPPPPPVADECCSVTAGQFAVFAAIDAALFLAITVGNTLVMLSVATYRHLRTNTHLFLASLAAADLLVAFVCLPADLLFGLGLVDTVDPWLCVAGSSAITITFSVSLVHLTVVAFDRFLAVTRPLKYGQIMSPGRVKLLVALSWGCSLTFGTLPFLGWNSLGTYDLPYCDLLYIQAFSYRLVAIFVVALVPIGLTGYLYLRIFHVARQHQRRIASEDLSVRRRGERALGRDLKAAKTLAIVLGTFLAAVTPAVVVSVADAVLPVSDLFICELVTFHILFSNSAVNPIVYACRNREFRLAFARLLGKVLRCRRWQAVAARANQSLVRERVGAEASRAFGVTSQSISKGRALPEPD